VCNSIVADWSVFFEAPLWARYHRAATPSTATEQTDADRRQPLQSSQVQYASETVNRPTIREPYKGLEKNRPSSEQRFPGIETKEFIISTNDQCAQVILIAEWFGKKRKNIGEQLLVGVMTASSSAKWRRAARRYSMGMQLHVSNQFDGCQLRKRLTKIRRDCWAFFYLKCYRFDSRYSQRMRSLLLSETRVSPKIENATQAALRVRYLLSAELTSLIYRSHASTNVDDLLTSCLHYDANFVLSVKRFSKFLCRSHFISWGNRYRWTENRIALTCAI